MVCEGCGRNPKDNAIDELQVTTATTQHRQRIGT